MDSKTVNLEEMKSASRQWSEKISSLQAKAESAEGDKKNAALGLIEELKQQQALFSQYLKHAEAEESRSWEKQLPKLDRMLDDIDSTYREVLSYFS